MSGQDEVTTAINAALDAVRFARKRFDDMGMDWLGNDRDPLEVAEEKLSRLYIPSLTAAAKRVEELDGDAKKYAEIKRLVMDNSQEFVSPEIWYILERMKSYCCKSLLRECADKSQQILALTAERDRLRAYAECMKCWRDYCHEVHEDKSDWSKTLRRHGWNPSMCGPVEFMDSILTTALSAKGEQPPSLTPATGGEG